MILTARVVDIASDRVEVSVLQSVKDPGGAGQCVRRERARVAPLFALSTELEAKESIEPGDK